MPIPALLTRWRADPQTAPNITAWETLPPRAAILDPLPADMPQILQTWLHAQGIHELYSHQSAAWAHARQGQHIVLATGTASGKSLAYNLPVLANLIKNPQARALYLYPTKALTQDQLASLESTGLAAAVYDGDTPAARRANIRQQAQIILTNPDMLHTGILPHHTNWQDFFKNLRFVVIDEMHTYRGVFGSHVANVIRRLKRIAQFHGATLQFVMTSATIGNPAELGQRLIEAPLTLIEQDGSARGPRHLLLYNPPIIDPALGLRKSSLLEAVRLTHDLLSFDVQNVVFARSRRTVELILRYLQDSGHAPSQIRGYRSGYLPAQRREIENGLRSGNVRSVVATNALELGIDIGGLGAAILVGYPGSIASSWQQAGRAGRGLDPAAAILITSAAPIDQFLAHHPEYFFGRSPEHALINPDHLLILLNHLRCAVFEIPFAQGEGFGSLSPDTTAEFLQFLAESGELHLTNQRFFWFADAYPAAGISLRSASPETVILQTNRDKPQTIGSVEMSSAGFMVHPGAIYLHEAQSYLVERLDLTGKIAYLRPIESDFYTEPLTDSSVRVLTTEEQAKSPACIKYWGEVQVTTTIQGFRKRRWYTHDTLGTEPLELPPQDLQTTAYWFSISDDTVQKISQDGLWTNAPNDYGPDWQNIRERARTRDGFCCQSCGKPESGNRQHDVHHKIPFRMFRNENGRILREKANQLENLTTLCSDCHRKAETGVRVRSGLAGLSYVLGNLAPLFLMCDTGDLGTHIEPVSSGSFPQPSMVLFDFVPAGIGFSQKLFELHEELAARALELVRQCPCLDGCPSCVGPGGENGMGGKQETLAILQHLNGH